MNVRLGGMMSVAEMSSAYRSISADQVDLLIREGEGLTVEFKERYSIAGTQVSVEVHDDRVEIANPGGLPKGLSVARLGKVSIRRNGLIADLFSRLHKVERTGMGIRKMRDVMHAAGLREPVFESDEFFFRVTFYRSPELALKKGIFATSEALSEKTREKILRLIRANPEITTATLAQDTALTSKGIEWNIRRLKAEGYLRRIGSDKGGRWEVLK